MWARMYPTPDITLQLVKIEPWCDWRTLFTHKAKHPGSLKDVKGTATAYELYNAANTAMLAIPIILLDLGDDSSRH